MTRPPDLHDRTTVAILDAAAKVFTERGEAASMAEVAAAAGVGRATLYRYFPNREALLRGLVRVAFEDVRARIAEADLAAVGVREGLGRLCRGFLTAGSRFAFMVKLGEKPAKDDAEIDRELGEPILELLRRGVEDGTLRGDLPVQVMFAMLTGLIERALQLIARGELGPVQAGDIVTSVFLDGAARRD